MHTPYSRASAHIEESEWKRVYHNFVWWQRWQIRSSWFDFVQTSALNSATGVEWSDYMWIHVVSWVKLVRIWFDPSKLWGEERPSFSLPACSHSWLPSLQVCVCVCVYVWFSHTAMQIHQSCHGEQPYSSGHFSHFIWGIRITFFIQKYLNHFCWFNEWKEPFSPQ